MRVKHADMGQGAGRGCKAEAHLGNIILHACSEKSDRLAGIAGARRFPQNAAGVGTAGTKGDEDGSWQRRATPDHGSAEHILCVVCQGCHAILPVMIGFSWRLTCDSGISSTQIRRKKWRKRSGNNRAIGPTPACAIADCEALVGGAVRDVNHAARIGGRGRQGGHRVGWQLQR